jgi:hypothetical protein
MDPRAPQDNIDRRRLIPDRDRDVWKYTTAVAMSLLIGVLAGQFIPNRNIVTTDQLNATIEPLKEQIRVSNEQTADMKDQLAKLTGELKARDVISKVP